MCSAFSNYRLAAIVVVSATTLFGAAPLSFRVCADPNSLPYSNQQQQGFENVLAKMIAQDLGAQLSYVWYPQREKFFRKTLNSGVCDVVMGVPAGFAEASTTRPYYRSTYVFVSRRDRNLHITSLDDPALKHLRIGVHVLGNQDSSLPPVHALVRRNLARNLVGFSIFGNLAEANPSADLIEAVTNKQVDIAVAWGPLAGYFGRHSPVPLEITPIPGDPLNPDLPLTFQIAMGVREGDTQLRDALNAELERREPQIQGLLRSYGIPQLGLANSSAGE